MPRKLLLRVCLLGCGGCFFKDLIVAYPNLKLKREIDKNVVSEAILYQKAK